MARFILDIAINKNGKEKDAIIKEVYENLIKTFEGYIASAYCIDKTNENQFHMPEIKNKLSKKQIENFNNILKDSV